MLTKSYQSIIVCLVWLLLMITITPAAVHAQDSPEETVIVSFEKLGYDDLRLHGLYGTNSLWIPFQSDWPIEGNVEIELTYTGSPLLNREAAIVTVLANNQEVTSFRPVGDGHMRTTSVMVPPTQRLAEGINITFAGHLRLTDDPCEDSFNIGQWLVIHNSSQVNINLAEPAPSPQLTDLPQAIMVQGSDAPAPVIFVLPEEADDLTLTTAAQVAGRLGESITTAHLPLRVATVDSLTDEDKGMANLVLVGLPDNQPLIRELGDQMPVPPTNRGFVSQDNILIPATDGVVQIFASPWHSHRTILLVSGNDSAGLAMAGQAFANQATFQSLTGSFHFIHSLVDRPEPAQIPPWLTAQTTFAQLGEFDREVTGLGLIESAYFFQYPPGVMLDERGQLVLHLAFSPALRAQRSYVEVHVNDIYVGAVDAARAGGDSWVSLDLPVRALNQLIRAGRDRELEVQLSIANVLPVNNCEPVNVESSWTKIYADSYFQLNYLPVELPDLYFFPYPFVTLANDVPLQLVVPPTPSVEELQTTLSLAALMGSRTVVDLDLGVMRSTAVTPESYAGQHFVLIGTPAHNTLLQEAVAELQTSLPVDVYQVLNAPEAGFFHALTSPWDEEMSVLAIYGETDTGFQAAAEALYEQGRLVSESGSIAMVRAGQEPVIIYREVGLSRPQVVRPDIILSEISQQEAIAAEPTATAAPQTEPEPTPVETEVERPTGLTTTERLILIITTFLIILVTVAALIRIAWRIRA
jgi:hypothetical protein